MESADYDNFVQYDKSGECFKDHLWKAVMEYMKQGDCPTDKLITPVYPPEKAQAALERWAENPADVFRILIEF